MNCHKNRDCIDGIYHQPAKGVRSHNFLFDLITISVHFTFEFRVTQLFEFVCTHSMAAYQCCQSKGWAASFIWYFYATICCRCNQFYIIAKLDSSILLKHFVLFSKQILCKMTAFSIRQKFGTLFSFILEIKK